MEVAVTAKVKGGSESLSEACSEWLPFNMAGNKIVKYSLIHIKIFIECLLCASLMNGCCLFQQGIHFPFPKSSYFLSNYLIPIPQFLGTSSGAPAFVTRDGHGYINWIFLSCILPSQRDREWLMFIKFAPATRLFSPLLFPLSQEQPWTVPTSKSGFPSFPLTL